MMAALEQSILPQDFRCGEIGDPNIMDWWEVIVHLVAEPNSKVRQPSLASCAIRHDEHDKQDSQAKLQRLARVSRS